MSADWTRTDSQIRLLALRLLALGQYPRMRASRTGRGASGSCPSASGHDVYRFALAPPIAVEQARLHQNIGKQDVIGASIDPDPAVGVADHQVLKRAVLAATEADSRGAGNQRAVRHRQVLATIGGDGIVSRRDVAIADAGVLGGDIDAIVIGRSEEHT